MNHTKEILIGLIIGSPPPNPPYPYPPLELLLECSTTKDIENWKKDMEDNWMIYKKALKLWRNSRAEEIKQYRKLIKDIKK